MQGVGLPYSLWLMIGTNVLTLITLALAWRIGRRFVSGWIAALAVYALFVSTPLLYYSSVEPMNSHAPGAFAAACFLFFLLRCTTSLRAAYRPDQHDDHAPRWFDWIALGVSAGATILVRWQLAAVVIPAWAAVLYERRWRGFFLSAVAAAITLLPLPLIWQGMFGAPFVVPYNEAFGGIVPQSQQRSPQRLAANPARFTADSAGLSRHDPARAPRWRWALLFAVMFFGQLIVNGAALDWNAGRGSWARQQMRLTRSQERNPLCPVGPSGLDPSLDTSWNTSADVSADLCSAGVSVAVTGAGRGIGRAIAIRLASAGARVTIGDIDLEAATAVADGLGDSAAVVLDVTRPEQFATFLDAAEQHYGPLGVLVNNAGVDWIGPFHEEPDEVTRREIEINLYGTALGTKLALSRMLPRRNGHIVNIASGAGRVPLPGTSTYSASKHGVVGLTESLRL